MATCNPRPASIILLIQPSSLCNTLDNTVDRSTHQQPPAPTRIYLPCLTNTDVLSGGESMDATTLPLDWDEKDGRRFVRSELVIILLLGGLQLRVDRRLPNHLLHDRPTLAISSQVSVLLPSELHITSTAPAGPSTILPIKLIR